jgi:hypothetical protein
MLLRFATFLIGCVALGAAVANATGNLGMIDQDPGIICIFGFSGAVLVLCGIYGMSQ